MPATSTPFLANDNQLLLLAQVATQWSVRPSALVEVTGVLAWQIDLACALRYWEFQAELARQSSIESPYGG